MGVALKRGDYDYHHATTNTQFLALLTVLSLLAGVGLTLGVIVLMILL
jgi:hypothetical protein